MWSISILGRTETFRIEDVYCVLMLSKRCGSKYLGRRFRSELQLVIDGANGRQRRHLMNSLCEPSECIPTIRPFTKRAGIRLLKARPFGVGRMKVTEL